MTLTDSKRLFTTRKCFNYAIGLPDVQVVHGNAVGYKYRQQPRLKSIIRPGKWHEEQSNVAPFSSYFVLPLFFLVAGVRLIQLQLGTSELDKAGNGTALAGGQVTKSR